VNVRYDPATDRFGFHIGITSQSLAPITAPMTFDLDLSPLQSIVPTPGSATVTITPTVNLLDFDVQLSLAPFVATVTGTLDLPSNGQLSADAHFTLMRSQGAMTDVTVPRDPTNATRDDLVADVNAALTAAGLSDLMARLNGLRLELTTPA